jgi:hypothetical protein
MSQVISISWKAISFFVSIFYCVFGGCPVTVEGAQLRQLMDLLGLALGFLCFFFTYYIMLKRIARFMLKIDLLCRNYASSFNLI